MPFPASLPELIVLGSWSCGTRTLSFARGKQTLGVKTHVWDWYFECTSTSPTAGQCPYRRLQTPSNVVSHAQTLAHKFSELLSWFSNRARGGIYCCKPINSAAVLLNTGQNPEPLHQISFIWLRGNTCFVYDARHMLSISMLILWLNAQSIVLRLPH